MGIMVNHTRTPKIYGTGLVALDIVLSADPTQAAQEWAGGTCGNVLTILSFMGWDSFPISRLNSDSSSIRVKKDMGSWNVKLDFTEMIPTASTPVITQEITKTKSGAASHKFHWRNCPKCGSWLPAYKPVTLKSTAKVKDQVQNGSVYFFDRTSPGALDLARHFREIGSIVIFEPSAKGEQRHIDEAIELADIVKYSDQRFTNMISDATDKLRPFLEIQTIGEEGLRFRPPNSESWCYVPAFQTDEVVDTCGCGDWTTAGLISQLCAEGRKDLLQYSSETIHQAFKYGLALGAWNCLFEGARGGMYQMSKKFFDKEIRSILDSGKYQATKTKKRIIPEAISEGLCPSCPQH